MVDYLTLNEIICGNLHYAHITRIKQLSHLHVHTRKPRQIISFIPVILYNIRMKSDIPSQATYF